ncbi:MAG: DUF1131 family protein [Desulfotalea sp.]
MKNYILTFTILVLFTACTAIADSSITIQEQSVGPISKETPFDVVQLKSIFPNYEVKQDVGMTEGMEYPIILISDESGILLTLKPDDAEQSIYNIFTERSDIPNHLGISIDSKYQKVFQNMNNECFPGQEESTGYVYCLAPKSEHIYLEFRGDWDGPDGVMPPMNVLNKYIIKRIIWMP